MSARLWPGAQAPECHRQAMKKQGAAPRFVWRLCEWMKDLAVAPTLGRRDLFGDCLAELTGSAKPEPSRPACAERKPVTPGVLPRGRECAPPKGPAPVSQPTPPECETVGQQRTIDEPQLRRMCGGEPQPVRSKRPPLPCDQPTAAKKVPAPLPPKRAEKSPREWLRGLAERAGRALDRTAATAPERTVTEIPGRPDNRSTSFPAFSDEPSGSALGAVQSKSESEAVDVAAPARSRTKRLELSPIPARLEDQWSLPLDDGEAEGDAVSLELLTRLSNGIEAKREAQVRPGKQHTRQKPAPVTFERDRAPLDYLENRETGKLSPPAAAAAMGLQSAAEVSAPAHSERPQLLLPPLLPPQWTGAPDPPVAAATIRYGARREEAEAREADLSHMAAKLKQILDEEARRHGINV